MMDVDHLLLDLDKAAMRYYLNKNTSEDDVKPSANVSGLLGAACFNSNRRDSRVQPPASLNSISTELVSSSMSVVKVFPLAVERVVV